MRWWVVWCALVLCACGARDDRTVLTVFAASSLTEAFAGIEAAFEVAHPGVDVVVSTAGSQALRLQIEHGASADVFASANSGHLEALERAGLTHRAEVFAHNRLAVVVPAKNPAGLERFEDLGDVQRLVLGAPQVPIGHYTQSLLSRLDDQTRRRIESRVVSREPNVRLVLAKVEIGEADAAVVYRSDVSEKRGVSLIEIPGSFNVEAAYHIGVLKQAPQPELARAWVDFMATREARERLEARGFRVE